jgi:hypothetical protein
MLQAGHRLGLRAEPDAILRPVVTIAQDHLEGHQPLEVDLPGFINDAHAAPAQLRHDLVARHRGKGCAGPSHPSIRSPALGVEDTRRPMQPVDAPLQLIDQLRTVRAQFLGRHLAALLAMMFPLHKQVH